MVEEVKELLETLRCPESHNTGRGSCRCSVNETIDDIKEKIEAMIRVAFGAGYRAVLPNDRMQWQFDGHQSYMAGKEQEAYEAWKEAVNAA